MNEDVESRLAHWVHWILLGGVGASGILLVIGLILFLALGQPPADETATSPLPTFAKGKLAPRPLLGNEGIEGKIMQLGLLILMATPMVRVLALALGWSIAKEMRFALVAWTVLALLGTSLALGFAFSELARP